jgi:hypothetical protein
MVGYSLVRICVDSSRKKPEFVRFATDHVRPPETASGAAQFPSSQSYCMFFFVE